MTITFFRGYVKVGFGVAGVSFLLNLSVHDRNAEQQFHHLFATLKLGDRHSLVGF